jgi:propionyl-CoA carboxylase alpha chain
VEHPVTELITGVDLVEQMIRSAAGEPLAFAQEDLAIRGWAIESRIYAEDPYRKFLPSIGRLIRYAPPPEGDRGGYVVRNDTGVREGDEISTFYDPMIAKLCAWAPDRPGAIAGMARALEDLTLEGPAHNTPFLSAVMEQPRFASGKLSTNYIPTEFPDGFHGLPPEPWEADIMLAVAAAAHDTAARRPGLAGALRRSAPRSEWVAVRGETRQEITLAREGETLLIALPSESRTLRLEGVDWRPGLAAFSGVLDGRAFTARVRPAAEGYDVEFRASRQRVLVLTPASAELHARLPPRAPPDTSRRIVSPMPGLVVSVDVTAGEEVKVGQVVCVIEAMKMQNIIRAERDGVIKTLSARAGETVAADDVLVEFA